MLSPLKTDILRLIKKGETVHQFDERLSDYKKPEINDACQELYAHGHVDDGRWNRTNLPADSFLIARITEKGEEALENAEQEEDRIRREIDDINNESDIDMI